MFIGCACEATAARTDRGSLANARAVAHPGVISFIDDASAGAWRYRLVIANSTQSIAAAIGNAWLTARELGGST